MHTVYSTKEKEGITQRRKDAKASRLALAGLRDKPFGPLAIF